MERLSIASFLALRTGRRTGGLDDCGAQDATRKRLDRLGTRALLLGEEKMKDALGSLGFRDGVHYLSVSPEKLKPQIEEALDPENRKEINEIRRRGQKLVLDRHLVEHRAKQIDDVFG